MSDTWIFGYGSLIWRPDFPFLEKCVADAAGWTRRFWQGSPDHRGVAHAPGRVVTLLPSPGEVCRGIAYRVEAGSRAAVIEQLDLREIGGFRLAEIELRLAGRNGPTAGYAYIATPENPNYLGPAALDAIAAQVRGSAGRSGPNVDYVLKLAAALRDIEAEDDHVFALAQLLGDGDG
jgi:cation transport regulator ChaC